MGVVAAGVVGAAVVGAAVVAAAVVGAAVVAAGGGDGARRRRASVVAAAVVAGGGGARRRPEAAAVVAVAVVAGLHGAHVGGGEMSFSGTSPSGTLFAMKKRFFILISILIAQYIIIKQATVSISCFIIKNDGQQCLLYYFNTRKGIRRACPLSLREIIIYYVLQCNVL